MESLQTILTIIFVAFFFFFSVFIHEFGHCIAAIWRGLHVDKFSVGFGHRIMAKKIKGIDCIVGWIPLGGYVALPQMELGKTAFAADGSELPPIKQKDKIIVALAGPVFNLAFALLLSLIVWGVGEHQAPAVESLVVEQVDEKGPE